MDISSLMSGVQVGGGVVAGIGALEQGKMTYNTLEAQAGMQQTQAQEAMTAGDYNAYLSGVRATQQIGAATAEYGASGVSTASGSPADVLMAGARNAEMDRQTILYGADLEAVNHENQASLDSFGANSALEGSYFKAIASVLGGASGALSNAATTPSSTQTNGVLDSTETAEVQAAMDDTNLFGTPAPQVQTGGQKQGQMGGEIQINPNSWAVDSG